METETRRGFSIKTLAAILIGLSLFILPILFWPNNIFSLIGLKLGLVFGFFIVALILWSILSLKKNVFNFPRNLLILSVILVPVSYLFSSFFSDNIVASFFGSNISVVSFVGMFFLFVMALLVSVIFDSKRSLFLFNLVIYFSVILTLFINLIFVFINKPILGFFVANSANTIGSWTDFGLLGVFGVITSFILIGAQVSKSTLKTFSWIGLVISILTVFIVNTLILWIILGVLSLVYLVYKISVSKRDSGLTLNQKIPLVPLIMILFSFFMILVGGLVSGVVNPFLEISFQETKPTLSTTFDLAKETLNENPVFGIGTNRFQRAWQQYKPLNVNMTNYWGSDFVFGNSFLSSVPVTLGIVGALSWLFLILMIISTSFKLLFKGEEDESFVSQYTNLTSVFSLLLFLLILTFHVPSETLLIYFFIFLGLFISVANMNGAYKTVLIDIKSKPRIGFIYIFSILALMIVAIYLGYLFTRQISARLLIEHTSYYLNTNPENVNSTNLINAVNIYPSDSNFRSLGLYQRGEIAKLLQNADESDPTVPDRFRNLLTGALNSYRAAVNYDPNNYLNYYSEAELFKQLILVGVDGSYQEAVKKYQMAIEKNPLNPGIYLDWAQAAFFAGENEEAKRLINKSLELKPNFANAAFLLSQIQVDEGNVEEAIRSVSLATQVNPTNANLFFQLGLLQYNQQNYTGAITDLENAVIRSPLFSNAKYFLGLSYERVGRTEDAIAQFEDLVVLNPENEEVKLILENLKSGNSVLFEDEQPPLDEAPENRDDLPLEETDGE